MSHLRPIAPQVSKPRAVSVLAAQLSIPIGNPIAHGVQADLDRILAAAGPISNAAVLRVPAGSAARAIETIVFPGTARQLVRPNFRNGIPAFFPQFPGNLPSPTPDFKVLTLTDGYLALVADGPVIFDSNRQMVDSYGSKYKNLLYYYDKDIHSIIDHATTIDGIVLVMPDDVWLLNYSHWLCDWLPRLATLGVTSHLPGTYVVSSPLSAPFQKETLSYAGFTDERIIVIRPWEALRAKKLLVPSDLGLIRHPSNKGSSWALSYLRETIGHGGIRNRSQKHLDGGNRVYVSRRDATRRRITNEDALIEALRPAGYDVISTSTLSVAEQAAVFGAADRIISLHGAGLANIVFAQPGTRVLELFASTYGTPAFYILAASQGVDYSCFISSSVQQGVRPQTDDITLDIEAFLASCGDLLADLNHPPI